MVRLFARSPHFARSPSRRRGTAAIDPSGGGRSSPSVADGRRPSTNGSGPALDGEPCRRAPRSALIRIRVAIRAFARYRCALPDATVVPCASSFSLTATVRRNAGSRSRPGRPYPSPLRRGRPLGSCATGGHRLWWTVEAADSSAALAQLPPYVAKRTVAEEVREVPIP